MSETLLGNTSRGVGLLVVALLKHYHWLSSGCLALIGQTSGKL